MKKLSDRVLEISRNQRLSHIGSCLSVLPILNEIYLHKDKNSRVILDNAHAHIAHLVIKEKYEGLNNIDSLIEKYGIHCDRNAGCDASGGSLGHGLGIAIGMALSDRKRKVYCVLSEGTLMEGSNWESLRIKDDLSLDNLIVYANLNGYTAVSGVNREKLSRRIHSFCPSANVWFTENGESFSGVEGHYKTL